MLSNSIFSTVKSLFPITSVRSPALGRGLSSYTPYAALLSPSSFPEIPSPLKLDSQSLTLSTPSDAPNLTAKKSSKSVSIKGQLQNHNTLDAFKSVSHACLLRDTAKHIWQAIKTGQAEKDPSLLCKFLLLSHAELKTYRFYHWFAFPALKPPTPFTGSSGVSLRTALGDRAVQVLATSEAWLSSHQAAPFWLIEVSDTPQAYPISCWGQVSGNEVLLATIDSGCAPEHLSWPARNFLLLAAVRWRLQKARLVGFRSRGGRLSFDASIVVDVILPAIPDAWMQDDDFVPQAVGWELNPKQKLGPRIADLGSSMDPVRLAESAAELNVRLMKWRAAPMLDIDKLSAARCLLLGAGTLGCAVARTLLGWGVRRITLVDSSRVSYSNPVRQSLYEFDDCLSGGSPKAAAAARRLQAIYPKVEAEGVEMSIPMPGHLLSDVEIPEAQENVRRLEALIDSHDVVYLLMDTRESRWLPTLLCAVHDKLAINAALGFDSFLVMRHGGGPTDCHSGESSSRLGCYYCNDVVAPLNSTTDRTLDQQCTVARPGLAPMAGALAVELMVTVLQHPKGVRAPIADTSDAALGSAPHMIRGQLTGFSQFCLSGQAFRQCTACSGNVVQQYKAEGWPWLLEALKDPKKLEDLTGLTELMNSAALDAAELESCGTAELSGEEEDFVAI